MSERRTALLQHVVNKNAETVPTLASLSDAELAVQVYSDEDAQWTVRDLLAHLADAETGQLGQVRRLLEGGRTVPDDFDVHRWNRRVVQKRAGQSATELVAEILTAHSELLALLAQLGDADLDKAGRHSLGDELTVEGYFRRIADHRAQHVAEIRAALGR